MTRTPAFPVGFLVNPMDQEDRPGRVAAIRPRAGGSFDYRLVGPKYSKNDWHPEDTLENASDRSLEEGQ